MLTRLFSLKILPHRKETVFRDSWGLHKTFWLVWTNSSLGRTIKCNEISRPQSCNEWMKALPLVLIRIYWETLDQCDCGEKGCFQQGAEVKYIHLKAINSNNVCAFPAALAKSAGRSRIHCCHRQRARRFFNLISRVYLFIGSPGGASIRACSFFAPALIIYRMGGNGAVMWAIIWAFSRRWNGVIEGIYWVAAQKEGSCSQYAYSRLTLNPGRTMFNFVIFSGYFKL